MEDSVIRRSFRQNLQQFILTDVRPLGNVLGTGSYGSVEEVMHNHVICAGKKLYDTLIEEGNEGAGNMMQKYLQECQLMSSLRHPHITLFLGICFLPGIKLPLLVMERLDTNLDDILEHMPNLPLSLKCSILEDTSSGLLYLHGRSPPIIHRDLTARNVLLTSSLEAKITDMGNSRIIDLKPGQLVRTLSQTPGTLVYMPPEALDDKHRYGSSLDIFSFGHLALFTIIQVFPGVLHSSTYLNPGNVEEVRGRTEVERRKEYIDILEAEIGQAHPTLVLLIKQCLHNAPHRRPATEELLTRLQGIKVEVEGMYQSSLLAKVEVMRARLESQVAKKVNLPAEQKQLSAKQPNSPPPKSPKLQVVEKQPTLVLSKSASLTPVPPVPRPRSKSKVQRPGEKHKQAAAVGSEVSRVEQDLKEQEWYWGRMSKHDVDAKFHRSPDGTFLVYDSHTKGKHVLIVRRFKANEVIHISHCNGMYGFLDTSKLPPKPILMDFPTIPALVEHFRRASLKKYNERLDITLDHPISRFTADTTPTDDTCDLYDDVRIYNPIPDTIRQDSAPSMEEQKLYYMTTSDVNKLPTPISSDTLEQNLEEELYVDTFPSDTTQQDLVENLYDSPPSDTAQQGLHESDAEDIYEDPESKLVKETLLPDISQLDMAEELYIDLPPSVVPQQEFVCLEEQRWYWGRMRVSEVNSKLSGTPDGTFLVCDSQTEGKHVLVVRKDEANTIVHISHANGMYGFFDMSVLPRKPILTEFPTIPALVEHFKQVPLTTHLNVTLAYPVSRFGDSMDSVDSEDSSHLKDKKWYWGGIGSEEISDKLCGTPNGTFLVRDSGKKGNYTLVVRMNGANKLVRINCSNDMYGFYDNSVNPPVLMEFPSVPALVEYFQRVPLTKYNASLDITLIHPLFRVTTVLYTGHMGYKESIDDEEHKYKEIEDEEYYEYIDDVDDVDDDDGNDNTTAPSLKLDTHPKFRALPELPPRQSSQETTTPVPVKLYEDSVTGDLKKESSMPTYEDLALYDSKKESHDEATSEILYDDLAVVHAAMPVIHPPRKAKDDFIYEVNVPAKPTGQKDKKEPDYIRLPKPSIIGEPKPHTKMDVWFFDIDRNTATVMLKGKPTGTFLCRPTKKSKEKLKGAVHTHTVDIVYNDDLAHLRVYHKNKRCGFEADPCKFSSLVELVMYFSDHPIHHNCDTSLKYPIKSM